MGVSYTQKQFRPCPSESAALLPKMQGSEARRPIPVPALTAPLPLRSPMSMAGGVELMIGVTIVPML
jgi:hypothetical protein